MALPLGRSYGAWVANTPFGAGDFILESAQDNITANAGGGQAGAFQITTQTARITVVANPGDSVQLPPATPGLELLLINHGANAMQVFGNAILGDTIDDIATATGVSQMSNSLVIYTCPTQGTPGKWYSEGLATGFATQLGLQTSSNSTIAANTGNTQGTGTPVTTMLTNVTATAAASITLPPSFPGLMLTVHNISAFTVSAFPNAGGTGTEKINSGGSNAALSMPTNTSAVFTCQVAGQWYTVPRTPS